MPSSKEILDFFVENWELIYENFSVFLFLVIISVTCTWFVLHHIYKKRISDLTVNKETTDNSLAEERRKVIDLTNKVKVLSEENERLKKQFEKLNLAGKIVASREAPEGVAAKRISDHFQEKQQ